MVRFCGGGLWVSWRSQRVYRAVFNRCESRVSVFVSRPYVKQDEAVCLCRTPKLIFNNDDVDDLWPIHFSFLHTFSLYLIRLPQVFFFLLFVPIDVGVAHANQKIVSTRAYAACVCVCVSANWWCVFHFIFHFFFLHWFGFFNVLGLGCRLLLFFRFGEPQIVLECCGWRSHRMNRLRQVWYTYFAGGIDCDCEQWTLELFEIVNFSNWRKMFPVFWIICFFFLTFFGVFWSVILKKTIKKIYFCEWIRIFVFLFD